MNKIHYAAGLALFGGLFSGLVHSEPNFLFYETFDKGLGTTLASGTRWAWQAPYSKENYTGMMIGDGDIYEISQAVAFKGEASLRLNFDGRNGWCNTCGADSYTVAEGLVNETSLRVAESGALTNQPNENRFVFNKTDSWALWSPASVANSTLFFQGGKPNRNEMGGAGVFNAGDEVKIARECGVDGKVGGDINRRSDCNLAINYLEGVSRSDFEYGESIARRFYLYVDQNTVLPNQTLKLGYTWLNNQTNGRYHVYPLISVQRNENLEVASRSIVGGHSFTGKRVERGTWYYLEEVYTRESSNSASDGTYDLYFYPHDQVAASPTISLTGITFGDLLDMSIIGNWQHDNDATGYLYIDEVAVADGYIGPVDGSLKEAAPPRPPTISVE